MPKLVVRTAKEIAKMTPERPPWVVLPWAACGSITEVVGAAKQAGKTTWLMALVSAVINGTRFMDHPVEKGPVVYLTEERPATLREALQRAGLLKSAQLHILSWHDTAGVSWPTVLKMMVGYAKKVKAKLLIVDTISQFAGMKGDTENDAGTVLQAFQPVQAAAAAGLAVIVVRHERKSGGSVTTAGRGSTAFAGAVDIVLLLRRLSGESRKTMRKLDALSRFGDTPDTTYIDRVGGAYIIRDGASNALQMAEDSILKILPLTEDAAITEKALFKLADIKRNTGLNAIQELLKSGKLLRLGKGVRNSPFKYMRGNDASKTSNRRGRRGSSRAAKEKAAAKKALAAD